MSTKVFRTEAEAEAAARRARVVHRASNNTDLRAAVYYVARPGSDPLCVLPTRRAGNAYRGTIEYRCAACGEWQTVRARCVPDCADCACAEGGA